MDAQRLIAVAADGSLRNFHEAFAADDHHAGHVRRVVHGLTERHSSVLGQVALVKQIAHGEVAASGGAREVAVHPCQDDLSSLGTYAGFLVRHDLVDDATSQLRAFTQHGVSDAPAEQINNRVAVHYHILSQVRYRTSVLVKYDNIK